MWLQKALHNQQTPFLNGDEEVVELICALHSFSADLVERGLRLLRHGYSKCRIHRMFSPGDMNFISGPHS